MKTIGTYINEKLRLTTKHQYTCQPKSKDALQRIIIKRIEDEGFECDLNDIDVSKITNMANLFDIDDDEIFKDFNGDISMWDVSNVKDMDYMFYKCGYFNCDLSKWNVSNVTKMNSMFSGCKTFNCDISKWNVSNVVSMGYMFRDCRKFNCDLSQWDVSNVIYIGYMFYECKKFNCDLSQWNMSNDIYMPYAFKGCQTQPTWYDKKRWEP